MGSSALDAVEISSDEEEAEAKEGSCPGKLSVVCPRLGWTMEVFADAVVVRGEPAPQQKKGKPRGVRAAGDDADDDCVVLDGDPDRPVAVAGDGKGKGSAGGRGSDELEVVAEQRKDRYINLIACRDFPHSRHLCSQFSFNTTPHVKHCSMCYCFVCDAPAPCKYWGNGLMIDDHCHATDKETKWKTLRQTFKCKSLPASHPEKHQNVVYPTMSSPRQQEYDEEYTLEDEEYYGPDAEGTLYVGNLRPHIDDDYLAQLFENVGIVEFSEILYDRETGQSRGYGYVTMSTVEEAEMAVNTFHRRELYGKLMTVEKAGTRSPSVRMFVGNLPCEVDGSMLKLLFSEHGQVVDTKVAYGYVRGVWRSRRFGFVTMASREESDDAICYLHRRIWKGCKLRVEVAKGVARRGS